MKKMKTILTGFAVIAIVGSALAFKVASTLGDGSVFCASTCTIATRVDMRVDSGGPTTTPCGAGVQPYVICGDGSCVATHAGTHFSTVDLGK